MRLRSPLPLATLALVLHVFDVPLSSATSWTAARKLEMRFVIETHRNWLYIYTRLRREATRGLWYHAYHAYMDYGGVFKRGKRCKRTEPAVQHFLWTNCDLYRVQEEVQTGIIRSF